MTVAETLLIYLAAPLAIVALLAVFTMRPDKKTRRTKYRPGQPWEHEPVWYAPHPGPGVPTGGRPVHGAGHGNGHGATALTAGARRAIEAGAPPARAAGPLGGARGTW